MFLCVSGFASVVSSSIPCLFPRPLPPGLCVPHFPFVLWISITFACSILVDLLLLWPLHFQIWCWIFWILFYLLVVGNTKETACCSGTPYFLLNRKYVHISVYRLSRDQYCPNRRSTGTWYCYAHLSGNNIFYRYSTSSAISKGCLSLFYFYSYLYKLWEQPCVPCLTSY